MKERFKRCGGKLGSLVNKSGVAKVDPVKATELTIAFDNTIAANGNIAAGVLAGAAAGGMIYSTEIAGRCEKLGKEFTTSDRLSSFKIGVLRSAPIVASASSIIDEAMRRIS